MPTPTFVNETNRWFGSGTTLDLTDPAVTSGRLYVIHAHVVAFGDPGSGLSLAGGGLTWTRATQHIGVSGSDRFIGAIFWAVADTTETITDLVLTIASSEINLANVAIVEVVDFDAGDPVGAVCSGTTISSAGSADPHTLALSATSASDSLVLSSALVGYDPPTSTLTVGSGWTSLHHNTSHWQRRLEYIEGAVSSVAYAHADWTHFVSTVGIEIKADGGASPIDGTAAFTEPNETLTGAATVAVAGVAAFTEPNETLTGVGTVAVVGSAEFTEPNETVAATVAGTLIGTAEFTEPNETLEGAGEVDVVAFGVFTEPNETLEGAGAVVVVGAAAFTEPNETLTGAGAVAIVATATFTEPNEVINSLVDTGVGFRRRFGSRIGLGIRVGI